MAVFRYVEWNRKSIDIDIKHRMRVDCVMLLEATEKQPKNMPEYARIPSWCWLFSFGGSLNTCRDESLGASHGRNQGHCPLDMSEPVPSLAPGVLASLVGALDGLIQLQAQETKKHLRSSKSLGSTMRISAASCLVWHESELSPGMSV